MGSCVSQHIMDACCALAVVDCILWSDAMRGQRVSQHRVAAYRALAAAARLCGLM